METLLTVSALRIEKVHGLGTSPLVTDLSFTIKRGEVFGLVGESGSGKSLTALALIGLLPSSLKASADCFAFNGLHLQNADEKVWRSLRAKRIGMVFQEPMTALNPTRRVRDYMNDILCTHQAQERAHHRSQMISSLKAMGVDDAERVMNSYPFQLSGGLRQRVLIATALLAKPDLLIADEATTALDATAQAQVLALLLSAAQERNLAVLMISHDLALVRHSCERILVMHQGHMIETGFTAEVIERPTQAYTRALLAAMPERGTPRTPLVSASELSRQ
jgi:ABC-type dipeptide/oligopeptide/nickel transport system ATPase component